MLLAVALAALVGLVGGLIMTGHLVSGSAAAAPANPSNPGAAESIVTASGAVPAQKPSAHLLASLPAATTWGVVANAPLDTAPNTAPSGLLITLVDPTPALSTAQSVRTPPPPPVPIYNTPGGPAIAVLPDQQLDGEHQKIGPTTVPVIDQQTGWVQVLLPSRPNHSTGWLAFDAHRMQLTDTNWLVRINRAQHTLALIRASAPVDQWSVAVGVLDQIDGTRQSVTPAGRTFIVADIRIAHPTYSPIILPLGVHSAFYDSYGDGPGTVGIHTWTQRDPGYGHDASHGCVRVPADALQILSTTVPIGTPVLIS